MTPFLPLARDSPAPRLYFAQCVAVAISGAHDGGVHGLLVAMGL